MKIKKFTDYALRTLIYLGEHPGRWVTIKEISEYYGIINSHLTKVVHLLSTSGFVASTRGRNGGIRLAKDPKLIPLGSVVRATEENLYILDCFDPKKQTCRLLPDCKLKTIIGAALNSFFAHLDSATLKDIINPPLK